LLPKTAALSPASNMPTIGMMAIDSSMMATITSTSE
jgi:isoaspartyl peptidase/L-asparaginase-like protein (Ntn-hydrolase superfamily)